MNFLVLYTLSFGLTDFAAKTKQFYGSLTLQLGAGGKKERGVREKGQQFPQFQSNIVRNYCIELGPMKKAVQAQLTFVTSDSFLFDHCHFGTTNVPKMGELKTEFRAERWH